MFSIYLARLVSNADIIYVRRRVHDARINKNISLPYLLPYHLKFRWNFITHLKKIGARRVFPCWDEPALKATFNISVHHATHHFVFSTMPLREPQVFENDGSTWSHFQTTPVMSTYLVGIVAVDLYRGLEEIRPSVSIWSRFGIANKLTFAQQVAETVLRQLTRHTNTTLILPKINMVFLPSYVMDSSSVWGVLLFR